MVVAKNGASGQWGRRHGGASRTVESGKKLGLTFFSIVIDSNCWLAGTGALTDGACKRVIGRG